MEMPITRSPDDPHRSAARFNAGTSALHGAQ